VDSFNGYENYPVTLDAFHVVLKTDYAQEQPDFRIFKMFLQKKQINESANEKKVQINSKIL